MSVLPARTEVILSSGNTAASDPHDIRPCVVPVTHGTPAAPIVDTKSDEEVLLLLKFSKDLIDAERAAAIPATEEAKAEFKAEVEAEAERYAVSRRAFEAKHFDRREAEARRVATELKARREAEARRAAYYHAIRRFAYNAHAAHAAHAAAIAAKAAAIRDAISARDVDMRVAAINATIERDRAANAASFAVRAIYSSFSCHIAGELVRFSKARAVDAGHAVNLANRLENDAMRDWKIALSLSISYSESDLASVAESNLNRCSAAAAEARAAAAEADRFVDASRNLVAAFDARAHAAMVNLAQPRVSESDLIDRFVDADRAIVTNRASIAEYAAKTAADRAAEKHADYIRASERAAASRASALRASDHAADLHDAARVAAERAADKPDDDELAVAAAKASKDANLAAFDSRLIEGKAVDAEAAARMAKVQADKADHESSVIRNIIDRIVSAERDITHLRAAASEHDCSHIIGLVH